MTAFVLTGSATYCPECGSDQVVQLAGQAGPFNSTLINNSSIQDGDTSLQVSQSLQELSKVREALCVPPPSQSFSAEPRHSSVLPSRTTAQMLALAVALFLRKTPALSQPEAAPSSSETFRATSPASPPTQTARAKTACSGATATPPPAPRRPSCTPHQLGDPHQTVSPKLEAWNFSHKPHSERAPLSNRVAV